MFRTTYELCGLHATAYLADIAAHEQVMVYRDPEGWKARHARTDTTWDLDAGDVPTLRNASR